MEKLSPWLQIIGCGLYILMPHDILAYPIPIIGVIDDWVAMWHMIRQLEVTGTLTAIRG